MNQESQKNNNVLIIIAIIGVVGTIVAATIGAIGNYNTEKLRQEAELTRIALISSAAQGGATQIVLQSTANTPTELPAPINKNLTATPDTKISKTPIVSNFVLFEENFEDGRAQEFNYISGDWKIVEENTGNKVYEIDNTSVSGFSSGLKFGSSSWQNYEIQYRVKMLNLIGNAVPEFLLSFRYNNSSTGYVQNLQPSSEVIDLVPVISGQWQEGGVSRHYKYSPNIWYNIRIIAQGSEIQIYINDILLIDKTDSQAKAGGINIEIGPGARIQIDDIRVIALDE
jgi:hypothetical protein